MSRFTRGGRDSARFVNTGVRVALGTADEVWFRDGLLQQRWWGMGKARVGRRKERHYEHNLCSGHAIKA